MEEKIAGADFGNSCDGNGRNLSESMLPRLEVVRNSFEKNVVNKLGAERLGRGLGWFSIGLGSLELLAPKMMARLIGVETKNAWLIRAFGLREILSGLAIFTEGRRPASSMWLRVSGDIVDLSALGLSLLSPNSAKARVLFATANVLAITALDVCTANQLSKMKGLIADDGAIRAVRSLFISKTPEELYNYWRNFENFPDFMMHLVSVESIGDKRSRWVAKRPGGVVEWDAEITEDRPNELIAWRSLPGSEIENRGTVQFKPAPGGRGTIIHVQIEYKAAGGMLARNVGRMFREEPLPQIKDDLSRFKQIVEVGEIVSSDGSPEGNGQLIQHPAQPAA